MATLYITEQGVTLSKTSDRIVVRRKRKVLQEIPAIKLGQIVVFGNANFTTPATKFILENNIDVAYLSSRGKYRGRFQPGFCKDALLRQNQYKRSLDGHFCLGVSKSIVRGKILNSLALCQRQRERDSQLGRLVKSLKGNLRQLHSADSLERIRGYEGAASAAYYKAFKGFLKSDLGFSGRTHHPPTDPVNALLSLGYTLLYNSLYSLINVVGLDPYQGFFHQTKHGHATLASDLMEEWRAIIVDSVVLSMINRGEIKRADFKRKKEGIRLNKEALGRFLKRYDARLAGEVLHPRLRCRISYGRCLELQVRHFADVIMNKEDMYQPFKTR